MNYNSARILACRKARKATSLKDNQREASIWNIICCLAKGKTGEQHAPKLKRNVYLREAKQRWEKLKAWTINHPKETEELCAPLIAEYEARAKARKTRELAHV